MNEQDVALYNLILESAFTIFYFLYVSPWVKPLKGSYWLPKGMSTRKWGISEVAYHSDEKAI